MSPELLNKATNPHNRYLGNAIGNSYIMGVSDVLLISKYLLFRASMVN